tara:strand:- start:6075 stop:6431 length:357 start_codon:yes stop_codon:yes gene_type:complete
MNFDIDELEKLLNRSSEISKEIDEKNKLKNKLNTDKHNYYNVNKAYKEYISQYSKSYIELSEHYYGPELPYSIYVKEFSKNSLEGTYLDTPNDVKELYKLFIFYGFLEIYLTKATDQI